MKNRHQVSALTLLTIACAAPVCARAVCSDPGLTSAELVILESKAVRFKTDVARRASVRLAPDEPFDIKVRRAEPTLQKFNNQPRYELAAYRLQKLLFDPASEVVPP